MARRRVGLGSTAKVHAKRATIAAEKAVEAARKTISFAEDGACEMAYANFKGMNFHAGEVRAHGHHIVHNEGLLRRAEHVFRTGCLKL